MFRLFIQLIVCVLVVSPLAQASTEENEAKVLYNKYQDRVYQIQVIEVASGEKSTIGSGFQITPEGHIATNYHVVSKVIHDPDLYRLEYVRTTGETGNLTVLDVDVVHDLAVVIGNDLPEVYIPLGSASLEKGTRIYSLGNPEDLGMAIVEGTYNGLLEKSLYEEIFFSGSINPGMSGGPAIDSEGNAIGINVSIMRGNQLSFLVPVHYLKALLKNVENNNSEPVSDFYHRIEEQLIENQMYISSKLSEKEWKTAPLGDAIVPTEIAEFFKCWGDSEKDEDLLYSHTYSRCATDDDIYLSSEFSTGVIVFRFYWYATKALNTIRFYNVYDDAFRNVYGVRQADKENVTNFVCKTDFVNVNTMEWKVALCIRKYKKYPRLYEIIISAALTRETDKGLVADFMISGVERETGLRLAQKFLESIRWKE
jgi:serine protease Do